MMYITQSLKRVMQINGKGIATSFRDRQQTWRQFGERVARLAGAFRLDGSVLLKGEGDVPARIRESVNELVDRARQRREELERRVDEGVREAAARYGMLYRKIAAA